MLKQPIYVEFNLDAKVNNSKTIAISHVDDKYSETLEVAVKQNDRFVYMGGATVVAKMVLHREKDYLLSDSVPCTVNDNGNILIPFDNAVVKTRQGTVKIEVNITRDEDRLTLQFPLWVSVKGSILDSAEVTPDSKGTIPELLEETKEALDDATEALEQVGDYNNLKNKPKFRFNSALLDPVVGTLEWNPYEFVRVGNNINLHSNIFRSYLGFNEILYDFNTMNTHADFYHSGVYKFNKSNISNLPEEFVDAGEFIYIYHYMTSGKDDFIRKVVYETTEGVKAWLQLATMGAADASGNAQIANQTAWVELTGTPKEDISGAVVTLNQSIYTYDGTSKAPSVTSVVLNGQTLIAGTDYAVIANPATNAGQYVVVINGLGDYKGTVTTAWEIAKAQATISGDDSITITGIDNPVTKTYTTDGDGFFSFAITGNIATVANVGGEVTITPTALGSTTMTVTLSEGANYLGTTKTVPVKIVRPVTVFGVMWDYSLSSPQLARLTPQTDPLGVVTTVPSQEPTACVGNDGNGQSDFDNYMPWAGMQRYNYVNGQVVDYVDYSNGETFVYIPDFWSKIVNDTTNSKMYFYISSAELSTFIKHPGSGRYMSRYECNENFLSASGFMPKVNTSLTAFRTGITAIDNKHFQYDFVTYNALELLYIIEFAHLNSQEKIGAGITSGNVAKTTGQTDILTYHTGRVLGADNLSAIQYRWVENLWGNVWNWVDGILIQNGLVYICNDANKNSSTITEDYISTELITPTISNTGTWYKTDNCYNNCCLIPATVGGSDSTYTCDYYYYAAGLHGLLVGGGYDNGSFAGLFCWNGYDDPGYVVASLGGRSILILGGDS